MRIRIEIQTLIWTLTTLVLGRSLLSTYSLQPNINYSSKLFNLKWAPTLFYSTTNNPTQGGMA